MQEGVEGLLRDKTGPSRIPALTPEVVVWVATRKHEDPPGETTHCTASLMASEADSRASFTASRRYVLIRSSGRLGISDGAMVRPRRNYGQR